MSLIDVLLSDLDKTITPCSNNKNEKKEEETQDAMPDSTTNTEKSNTNPFHCGDDVLVPNKDGRYYLGLYFMPANVRNCILWLLCHIYLIVIHNPI